MTNGATAPTTGVRTLDVGHECLMFIVEQFYHPSVICHEGEDAPCRRIGETIRFVRRLLEREERLMTESGYAEASAHIEDHREFLARLEALHSELSCSRYDNRAVDTLLRDWSREHVERFDRHFAAWLESRGLSPAPERRL